MTSRLDAQYPGLFTLLGYDLPETSFSPGERIAMDFYYRVDARIDKDLFFFVNLEGPPGFPIPPHFHAHHYPIHGRYRTTDWRRGEILRDSVQMVIPREIRHPVDLRVTLTVLDGNYPLEFRSPRTAGTVIDVGSGVVTVALPGGGRIKARGSAAIGQKVFVRDDAIEGIAPSLTLEIIEI